MGSSYSGSAQATLYFLPFNVPLKYDDQGVLSGRYQAAVYALTAPPGASSAYLNRQYFPYNILLGGDLISDVNPPTIDAVRAAAFSHFEYNSSQKKMELKTLPPNQYKHWFYSYDITFHKPSEKVLFTEDFKEVIGIGGPVYYGGMNDLISNLDDLYTPVEYGSGLPGEAQALVHRMFNLDGTQNKRIDATFAINKPFGEVAYEEAAGAAIGLSDPVKIDAHYNFYLQPYETITKKTSAATLPNIYGLMYDVNHQSHKYWDQWSIDSKSVWPGLAGSDEEELTPFNYNTDFNGYLNRFATQWQTFDKNTSSGADKQHYESVNLLFKKYKTVGISAYAMQEFMEDSNIIKQKFPMHVDIEIPTANEGQIGKILYENNFFDDFMRLIMGAMYPRYMHGGDVSSPPSTDVAIFKRDSFLSENPTGEALIGSSVDNFYLEKLAKLYLNDLLGDTYIGAATKTTWASGQEPEYLEATLTDALKLLNPEIGDIDVAITKPLIFGETLKSSLTADFINNIKWLITKNKILKFIKDNTRSVKQIYDGEYAHSEVLFYEVVKYRTTSPVSGHLPYGRNDFDQNMFIPNVPGMDVLKYIDTQVSFDEKYYYQIYAHTMVIGTEYEPIDVFRGHKGDGSAQWEQSAIGANAAEWIWIDEFHKFQQQGGGGSVMTGGESVYFFDYAYKPSVYLMRVPFYNTYVTTYNAAKTTNNITTYYDHLEKTIVFDKPPVFPDAVVLPLYGKKDSILVNVNFNAGEYELEPVYINPDEKDIDANINKIRINQKKMEGPITYRGDDFSGIIELLRIDEKPTSYEDFSPVSDSRVASLGGDSAFGFIDDTLCPDKTYYYIVRAQDVHGSYSNPSPVYEVRIVTVDGETPYLSLNIYFMDELKQEKEKPAKNLNMMKYIRIAPAFLQSYLDQADILAAIDDVADVNTATLTFGEPAKTKDVFGKKFKFRFTSKRTGKKFDLNINVKRPTIEEKTGETTN